MSIANELITRGWTTGRLQDSDGRVCLLGAACYAVGPHVDFMTAVRALSTACGGLNPATWQDIAGRTYDEVLRVAKMADEILDA